MFAHSRPTTPFLHPFVFSSTLFLRGLDRRPKLLLGATYAAAREKVSARQFSRRAGRLVDEQFDPRDGRRVVSSTRDAIYLLTVLIPASFRIQRLIVSLSRMT
jgi:hypothetical protein